MFLSLDADNGFFTDNYFDLIPGEIKTLENKTKDLIDDLSNKIKFISLVESYKN